jgi:hypothetical protein
MVPWSCGVLDATCMYSPFDRPISPQTLSSIPSSRQESRLLLPRIDMPLVKASLQLVISLQLD